MQLLRLQYRSSGGVDHRPAALVHADCPYTLKHYLLAFSRRPAWRVLTRSGCTPGGIPALYDQAVLWLDEYESLDWGVALSPPYRLLSNFCIRKGLGRKANFAQSMAAYLARRSGELQAVLGPCLPHTVVLDLYSALHSRPRWLDRESALAEALCEAEEAMSGSPGQPWILKPSITNKGAGIVIVHSLAELEAEVCREQDIAQWVLQRYLTRTLLLPLPTGGAHKFHVRVYCLAVGALEVHVFREALLLLAPEPFAPQDTSRTAAHITNTCVSTGSASFSEALHVRCLSELPQLAGVGSARVAELFARMCSVVGHCFAAQEGKAAGFMPLPLAWELYGVDFLVGLSEGGEWVPVVLEFNPTPDVRQTGTRLDGVIGALLEGVLQLALDGRVRPLPQGCCAAPHGSLAVHPSRGLGPAVVVDTLPRPPTSGAGVDNGLVQQCAPSWYPGCSGAPLPFALPPAEGGRKDICTHHSSGFDCVYTKYWPSAHNSLVRVN